MLRQDRAVVVQQILDAHYPTVAIPLDHRDPYTLLVAVLLSAQCTDIRVNQVTPRLFELADRADAMARQRVAKIQSIIRPCGLSERKAKAISQLSKILTDQFDGRVPQSFEELESLPGVGHKTASVVMCQAFGLPAFPVDTHIHRLGQRWGLTSGKSVVQTERDLKKLFQEDDWGRLHLQFIYFGREYCSARGCDGTVCEICRTCYPKRRRPFISRKA